MSTLLISGARELILIAHWKGFPVQRADFWVAKFRGRSALLKATAKTQRGAVSKLLRLEARVLRELTREKR